MVLSEFTGGRLSMPTPALEKRETGPANARDGSESKHAERRARQLPRPLFMLPALSIAFSTVEKVDVLGIEERFSGHWSINNAMRTGGIVAIHLRTADNERTSAP
jgi:hypothetical protein